MSSTNFIDLCSQDKINTSNDKHAQTVRNSGSLRLTKAHQGEHSISDQSFSSFHESPSSTHPTFCPPPICRQFWKAGSYHIEQNVKAPIRDGKNHLRVHPLFLHSNATSHKWAFGAIAELLDNAVDEIQNGATFVLIDKICNPRNGSPCLLVRDDGGGMDPEAIRRCMSFGFSDKKLKSGIGQYGNGFKTSSMRLGADVIVFTRNSSRRTLTRSVGLLSYTFLRQTGHDRIVVPMVDYEFDASTKKFKPMHTNGSEHFSSNLSVLLQWSPYPTEEIMLKQFDDIGDHGTKIIVYNLWQNGDGEMELDFNFDDEDIRISADADLLQTAKKAKAVSDQHIANLYHYSLRVYASILYLRLPESFQIILRGKIVDHHNIANDMKFLEFILYRPQFDGMKEAAVITTIGFLKDAPLVNIHGFNIYHRNRLILPFWRAVKDSSGSVSRGVVGVLEANFVEPTHNKQDFEKTSLFQKLEARLKEMTVEYWHLHCELIGYQPLRKLPSASVSSYQSPSSGGHNFVEEPVLVNDVSYNNTERTSRHFMPRGLKRKRKNHDLTLELETTVHAGSGSNAVDTKYNQVEQSSAHDGALLLDDETRKLMLENHKLRSQLSELERSEEDLNIKMQLLRRELCDVQSQYATLLAESESLNKIKAENYVNG